MSGNKSSNRWALLHSLRALFVVNYKAISTTYLMSALENFFNLLYPFATGLAINDLLANNGYGSLAIFLGIWFAHLVTGVIRQRYDTAVFTQIYAGLATNMVTAQQKKGVPNSMIVARSSLARELVDFFEQDIPNIIALLFNVIGSVIMLFWYDFSIGVACIAIMLPMWLVNGTYVRKSLFLNQQLNDQLEKEAEVLGCGDRARVEQHYGLLSRWRTKLSNVEATNWGIMEAGLIVVAAFVIVRAAALSTVEAGTIYAIMAYLWTYVASLVHVPGMVQRACRLRDISDRIAQEGDIETE